MSLLNSVLDIIRAAKTTSAQAKKINVEVQKSVIVVKSIGENADFGQREGTLKVKIKFKLY